MLGRCRGHASSSPVVGAQTPTLKWARDAGGGYAFEPSVAADGTIYICKGRKLHAFRPDGTLKWAFTTGTSVSSTPAIGTDSTIYFGSYDQNLYALAPDGSQKWAFATDSYVQ